MRQLRQDCERVQQNYHDAKEKFNKDVRTIVENELAAYANRTKKIQKKEETLQMPQLSSQKSKIQKFAPRTKPAGFK